MVEQEIAKLDGHEITDGKSVPFSYTYTFSFPVFYLVLLAGDQFETRNTKRKPRETLRF